MDASVRMIADAYDLDPRVLVQLNKARYKGLQPNAVLIEGSILSLPSDDPRSGTPWIGGAQGAGSFVTGEGSREGAREMDELSTWWDDVPPFVQEQLRASPCWLGVDMAGGPGGGVRRALLDFDGMKDRVMNAIRPRRLGDEDSAPACSSYDTVAIRGVILLVRVLTEGLDQSALRWMLGVDLSKEPSLAAASGDFAATDSTCGAGDHRARGSRGVDSAHQGGPVCDGKEAAADCHMVRGQGAGESAARMGARGAGSAAAGAAAAPETAAAENGDEGGGGGGENSFQINDEGEGDPLSALLRAATQEEHGGGSHRVYQQFYDLLTKVTRVSGAGKVTSPSWKAEYRSSGKKKRHILKSQQMVNLFRKSTRALTFENVCLCQRIRRDRRGGHGQDGGARTASCHIGSRHVLKSWHV